MAASRSGCMKTATSILFLVIALFSVPAFARTDTVGNAYAVCRLIDSTGLGSKPCEVSAWDSAVIATLDMTSAEARSLCIQLANLLYNKNIKFDGRWTLQIKSPFSGNNSIAFCRLR